MSIISKFIEIYILEISYLREIDQQIDKNSDQDLAAESYYTVLLRDYLHPPFFVPLLSLVWRGPPHWRRQYIWSNLGSIKSHYWHFPSFCRLLVINITVSLQYLSSILLHLLRLQFPLFFLWWRMRWCQDFTWSYELVLARLKYSVLWLFDTRT